MLRLFLTMLLVPACWPAIRIVVTVVEQKTGRPVTDLKASDFVLWEDKTARPVQAAEFASKPVDVLLMIDTGLAGGAVQPVISPLIGQLQEKEQMAIVAFDSSAEMIQDFTASRQILTAALAKLKYGNTPRVLDSVFAAMESGFDNATYRRVILLVTAGLEGYSRISDREVVRLARKNGVSVYPVYAAGSGRSLLENLARQTGGASFSLRDLEKSGIKDPAPRIFDVVRGHYTLTVPGNLGLGEKIKVEVKRPDKLLVSALPLD